MSAEAGSLREIETVEREATSHLSGHRTNELGHRIAMPKVLEDLSAAGLTGPERLQLARIRLEATRGENRSMR